MKLSMICEERIIVEGEVINEGWFDTVLDAAGIIPGIGWAFDLINGLRHLLKGNLFYAAISFISVVPLAGDTSKILKYITKYGGKTGGKVAKYAAKMLPQLDSLWKTTGTKVAGALKNQKIQKAIKASPALKKAAETAVKDWDKIGAVFKDKVKDAAKGYVEVKKEQGKQELKHGKSGMQLGMA